MNCDIYKPIQLFLHTFENIEFLLDSVSSNYCYKKFETVYHTDIAEQFHFMLMMAIKSIERVSAAVLTNTKVCDIIQYFQYKKF
uniref:Uncharacterized protein n=1 Tax=Rhizophagus irregularis (strain DAOM 181602 / DAOM 197198 / MUCL 43194) TaxID=747089 RepID=U9TFW0_RHIID